MLRPRRSCEIDSPAQPEAWLLEKNKLFSHGCGLYLCVLPFDRCHGPSAFCELTVRPHQRHGCEPMHLETKFLRLPKPVELGEQIEGWRVCWLGGWDKNRIFYMVMVVREGGLNR